MLKGKQKHFLQDLLTTELWNIAGWKKRPKLKNMFETYAIHNVLKIVNKLSKMFQIKLPKKVNKKNLQIVFLTFCRWSYSTPNTCFFFHIIEQVHYRI